MLHNAPTFLGALIDLRAIAAGKNVFQIRRAQGCENGLFLWFLLVYYQIYSVSVSSTNYTETLLKALWSPKLFINFCWL